MEVARPGQRRQQSKSQRAEPVSRSENIRRIMSKDTGPEWLVRRIVWGFGFRYRLHRKDLPGRADLAFGPAKKAIFVHGCFWHQHGIGCADSRVPKTNVGYWGPKLIRNFHRDEKAIEAMTALGWQVLVVWDCETKSATLSERLHSFLTAGLGKSKG